MENIEFDVPILSIIFNRDYTAIEVFKKICEIKPKKLYVAADGPRDLQEKARCDKTREIIKLVDWECELHCMFRDENLGCKYGPYTGISWWGAFSNVHPDKRVVKPRYWFHSFDRKRLSDVDLIPPENWDVASNRMELRYYKLFLQKYYKNRFCPYGKELFK